MPQLHKRTCHLCEANCGIVIETEGRKVLSIKGNPDNALSEGYICPKATAIADLQDDPDRLRKPVKRVGDEWQEISFEQAYKEIAERLVAINATGKRASLFLGNPTAHNFGITTQMRHISKAIAARGVYSASTLDQIPHMVAYKLVYGHFVNYTVCDIDRTNYMLIIGGNPAASNGSLWTVPNVRERIKRLQKRGGKLVVIDPRRTETAKLADEHHFIRPGADTAFLLALLHSMDRQGLTNPGRLTEMLDDGWETAWAAIRSFDAGALAAFCSIDQAVIDEIAREISADQPAIVYGRMGVSVARFGTVNHWLIQLANIASGNLDREGGVMFGAPVHDPVESSGSGSYGRYSSRISGQPEVFGEFPSAELADDITEPGDGQIGALFTLAGNPVLSSPGGRQLDNALEKLDLMVSLDMYVTATTRHADYILPPCGPLEKDHYPLLLAPLMIRNFACYSPPVFEKEGGAKADWEILYELSCAVNEANGEPTPPLTTPRQALGTMMENSSYDITLADLDAAPDGIDFGPLYPRLPDRLKTEDKRLHCAPSPCMEDLERFRAEMEEAKVSDFVVIGRRHIRNNNSWMHNSHRLIKGKNRCTLMMHPDDAERLSLGNEDIARVSNHVGAVELPVEITEDIMPGVVSIPHGFGHNRKGVKLSIAAERPGVSLNDLTDPAKIDVLSGNAVLNGVPVEVEAV